jgi:uncharacterized membrane protein YcaP (DUF421 family)
VESVIRGAVVYLFLLIVFRIAGKRTLSEATPFDLVLLLIISETTQQAMVDGDHSMTNGALLVFTLLGLDIGLSLIKQHVKWLDPVLDGTPVVLVENGQLLKDRMDRERVDEDDILEAARLTQGINAIEEIRLAVLERGGKISVVPLAK